MKKLWIFSIVLIIVLFVSAAIYFSGGEEKKDERKSISTEETKKEKSSSGKNDTQVSQPKQINIYFSDDQAQYLVPEVRETTETDEVTNTASYAISELIKGPTESSHYKTIPEGTRLLNVELKEAILNVNFSQEFSKNYPQGSASETMTVYSIVNTLTELPNIKKVKFLVDGKKVDVEVVGGQMDLAHPISRNKSINKK